MEGQAESVTEQKRDSEKVSDSEKISDNAAVLHLVKGNIGIGVLAIPSALLNAGLAVGTLGLALIALTTVHCMHLLGNISHFYSIILLLTHFKKAFEHNVLFLITI